MRFSIRFSLLFFLLGTVPLMLVGLLAYWQGRQTIETITIHRLASINDLKAEELNDWLEDHINQLEAFAQRPQVRSYSQELWQRDPTHPLYVTSTQNLLKDHLLPASNIMDDNDHLDMMILSLQESEVLASTDPEMVGRRLLGPWENGELIQTVLQSPTAEYPYFSLATTILGDQEFPVAIVVIRMDLSELSSMMKLGLQGSASLESYLIDAAGWFLTESRFQPEAIFQTQISSDASRVCHLSESGSGVYTDYRDVEVIGVFRWLPEFESCLLTEQDQSEAIAPQIAFGRQVLLIGIVMALVSASLGLLFAHFLSEPLRRLTEGVQTVEQGDLDVRTNLQRKDEFGRLSQAFDRMAEALKSSMASRDELNREVEQREKAEENLQRLNQELEARVQQRTEALMNANKELESFSYSVSHDLRAPLRAIDAFSRILMKSHDSDLSPEAKRYLGHIVDNTEQMSQLISDLLDYSRTSRKKLRNEHIDIQSLVESLLATFEGRVQELGAQIAIGELPAARGDPTLLRQVFSNLIDNGLKFTQGCPDPQIEIGTEVQGPSRVYFVRDNGVGFDMRYVEKLFGVFQRLHSGDEFDGTGVGLAIVQNVIQRHGGRIWANSVPGEGSTFYFTLEGAVRDVS